MLTCYGDEVQLPQNDLAYVGFRLALLDTLYQMETANDLDEGDETPFGYIVEVPFLERIAPAVQVDLLADVWARHKDEALHEASLLDAAVVYAAFHTARRVMNEEPEIAQRLLKTGPRPVRCRLGKRTSIKLRELFFAFWDDIDFLSIEALQDLDPDHARAVRSLVGVPEGEMEEMEAALTRVKPSPDILTRLEGLLTDEEIRSYGRLMGVR